MKDDLDTPVSLRIDSMTKIKNVKPEPKIARKFKVSKDAIPSKSVYRLQHPVMYGGKVLRCRMLIRTSDKNGMMNALVDTFGRNIKMREATTDELKEAFKSMPKKEYPDEKWIRAEVEGSLGGMVLFAMQYCQNVRMISPDDVVAEICKRLEIGCGIYQV